MNRTNNQIAVGVRRAMDDLAAEGCDLILLPEAVVRGLIHEHLDYFLMMVGPSSPAEESSIVAAVMHERLARRTPSRRHPTQRHRLRGEAVRSAAAGAPEPPPADRKADAAAV